jgi:hypothetical protein
MLLCLMLFVSLSAFSQSQWELELSHEMSVPRMGVWTRVDYSILVSLDSLSSHFRRSQHELKRSIDYYVDRDSSLLNYFSATAQRYDVAAFFMNTRTWGGSKLG